MDSKVNDKFLIWLNKMYGTNGEVKSTRGTVHDYLGITFDLSEKGKVKVDIIDYMIAMVDDFFTKFKPDDTAPNPVAEDLFAEGTTDDLYTQQAAEYHTFVANGLFSCKLFSPDIRPTISALSKRVKIPIGMIGTNYTDCFDTLMEQETTDLFYLPITFTSSSGTWTQLLLCIQNLRVVPVLI